MNKETIEIKALSKNDYMDVEDLIASVRSVLIQAGVSRFKIRKVIKNIKKYIEENPETHAEHWIEEFEVPKTDLIISLEVYPKRELWSAHKPDTYIDVV